MQVRVDRFRKGLLSDIFVFNQTVKRKVSHCSDNGWLFREELENSTHNSFGSDVVHGKNIIDLISQLQIIKVLHGFFSDFDKQSLLLV